MQFNLASVPDDLRGKPTHGPIECKGAQRRVIKRHRLLQLIRVVVQFRIGSVNSEVSLEEAAASSEGIFSNPRFDANDEIRPALTPQSVEFLLRPLPADIQGLGLKVTAGHAPRGEGKRRAPQFLLTAAGSGRAV